MRSRIARLLLAFTLVAFAAAPALAQYSNPDTGSGQQGGGDEASQKKKSKWGVKADGEEEWGPQYELGLRTGEKIVKAREFLLDEEYDKCEAVLKQFNLNRLNPLERARVYQIWAFVYYGREDIPKTQEYLEKTLAENGLPKAEAIDIRFQIAQLHLQQNEWEKAAENLELWLTLEDNPNAAAFHTLALTYYQMDQLDKALPNSIKAVEMTDEPREGWLQLLLALRLTNKEYREAIPLLEQLVRLYPSKTYWLQLSTVHGALEHYSESLVQLQLAYEQGLLDESEELQRLAELMLFLELPYRAAIVVEKGLEDGIIEKTSESYELLSNSHIAARDFEESLEPLEKAAQLADTGELYVRLAQVHLQGEDWEGAAEALRKAMEKGGLPNQGDAQLLMGIAYYSKKEPEKALTWFGRASRHAETAQEAGVWLKHIERELQSS